MDHYSFLKKKLLNEQKKWLVTGVAGFIGSHLLENLLKLNQYVVGLDNFATGHQRNLDEVRRVVKDEQWERFQFYQGDVCVLDDCHHACRSVDYVLHQAALGSVPRSLVDPVASNATNVNGFLNMLVAARLENVKSFVYAASSSTYGDDTSLPKVEDFIGKPLSPYGLTKYVNELYADVFVRSYGFNSIGLRYFNVFGPRQDPGGSYAAVIPIWTSSMINDEAIVIYGDGETSRDFCYVDNVVQANLLAAHKASELQQHQVFNVAVGERTSLNKLYTLLKKELKKRGVLYEQPPTHKNFRKGDIKHTQASIDKASQILGYAPTYNIEKGIDMTMPWYMDFYTQRSLA